MAMRILYKERLAGGEIHAYGEFPNVVEVTLRKWHDESTQTTEYTMREFVLVDAEPVVDNRRVIVGLKELALIRMAIKSFDRLLESHPNKNEMSY